MDQDISPTDWAAAQCLWNYHQLNHQLNPTEAAIGLGCHDLGVATFAAQLYHKDFFPILVFSGASTPATSKLFPRGEAIHFREQALELSVPDKAILIEPEATNTGENITLSRQVLQNAGLSVKSILLVCMPYMQRRAYSTCRKVWPEVQITCASTPLSFGDYVKAIGNARQVIDHLTGDMQRIIEYPRLGYAIPQDVPKNVYTAYKQLVDSGFTSRMFKSRIARS